MGRCRIGVAGLLVLSGALGLGVASAGDPATDADAEQVKRGQLLYRIYCGNCHGETGTGDGPTAEVLRVPPADLTRLGKAGEPFPRERIYGTIDGREEVRGHGRRQMPIWGLGFQEMDVDTDQEDEVRGKIDDLIAWL